MLIWQQSECMDHFTATTHITDFYPMCNWRHFLLDATLTRGQTDKKNQNGYRDHEKYN